MLGFISVMNLFFWLGANFSWLMDYMLKLYRPIPLLQTNPFVIYNTALNLLLRPWSTQTITKNCSTKHTWWTKQETILNLHSINRHKKDAIFIYLAKLNLWVEGLNLPLPITVTRLNLTITSTLYQAVRTLNLLNSHTFHPTKPKNHLIVKIRE